MSLTIEDGKYTIGHGMGAWAKSKEKKGLSVGDVRLIGGILMSVYQIYFGGFFKNIYWWTPVHGSGDYTEMKEWIKKQVGC